MQQLSILAVIATVLVGAWIVLLQRRERQRILVQQQVDMAERKLLEEGRRHEETERKLLEQRLAPQAAEQKALELQSQLYASIGIMAGSYAHNIKNLLVRPNDLLRRCLEADGLSGDQQGMLHEVQQTLGTVTERLQQILRTVRRDPNRTEQTVLDLNAVLRDLERTWRNLARDRYKLEVVLELGEDGGPLWIAGDFSHLQQAVENLLFNARDATFEMRNHLRDAARRDEKLDAATRRQALIAAAAWKGRVVMRTRPRGERGRAGGAGQRRRHDGGGAAPLRRDALHDQARQRHLRGAEHRHGAGAVVRVGDFRTPPGENGDRIGAAEGGDVPGTLPGGGRPLTATR